MDYSETIITISKSVANVATKKYPFLSREDLNSDLIIHCMGITNYLDKEKNIKGYLYNVCNNFVLKQVNDYIRVKGSEDRFIHESYNIAVQGDENHIEVELTNGKNPEQQFFEENTCNNLTDMVSLSGMVSMFNEVLDRLGLEKREDMIENVFIAKEAADINQSKLEQKHIDCLEFMEKSLVANGFNYAIKGGKSVADNISWEIRKLLYDRVCCTPEDVVIYILKRREAKKEAVKVSAQYIAKALWCIEGMRDAAIDIFNNFSRTPSLEEFVHALKNKRIVHTQSDVRNLYKYLTRTIEPKKIKELNGYKFTLAKKGEVYESLPIAKDAEWFKRDCKEFAEQEILENNVVSYEKYISHLNCLNILFTKILADEVYVRTVKPEFRVDIPKNFGNEMILDRRKAEKVGEEEKDIFITYRSILQNYIELAKNAKSSEEIVFIEEQVEALINKYVQKGGNPLLLVELNEALNYYGGENGKCLH